MTVGLFYSRINKPRADWRGSFCELSSVRGLSLSLVLYALEKVAGLAVVAHELSRPALDQTSRPLSALSVFDVSCYLWYYIDHSTFNNSAMIFSSFRVKLPKIIAEKECKMNAGRLRKFREDGGLLVTSIVFFKIVMVVLFFVAVFTSG